MSKFLSIIWHFHQPCYILKDTALLPWVRLHTVKNYLPMTLILEEFPDIRCTINITPSLLEQLKSPVEDFYLKLSKKPIDKISTLEKSFIISRFFTCSLNMIKQYPRYLELYEKMTNKRYFSTQDIFDLIIYFNLTWINQVLQEKDTNSKKNSNFTDTDRFYILELHKKSMAHFLEKLGKLFSSDQIELITSPFYHTILPLLIKYNLSSDASTQIRDSLSYFESIFEKKPTGMWPSELALSEDAVKLIKDCDIKWVIADEDLIDSETKNFPHNFAGVDIILRSKFLSNLISFTYKDYEPDQASSHLIEQIENTANKLPDNSLITIALDGENPWEHYKNGVAFLRDFYRKLQESKIVTTITPTQYLSRFKERKKITKLGTGSWINNSLDVWSAHEEDQKAWQLLKKARNENGVSKSLYIAEGSDWFWWFGPEFSTSQGAEFDMLFRRYLASCYKKPPLELFYPIKRLNQEDIFTTPWALLQIELDGRITDYFEWLAAGKYNFINEHDPDCEFNQILFGTDEKNIFFCVDHNNADMNKISFNFILPKRKTVRANQGKFVLDHVLEVCYPLETLEINQGDLIEVFIEYDDKRFPTVMPLRFTALSSETKKIDWSL